MHSPVALFRLYLAQLWVHLSVVQTKNIDQQQPTTSTINRTYLATFITFSFAIVYGSIGLHLEGGEPLTVDSLRTSVYYFWRQMFLREIWLQVEIFLLAVVLGISATLLDFALKGSCIEVQHQLVIDGKDKRTVKLGGQDVSDYESTKLISMFRRSRMIYQLFGWLIYTMCLLYSYLMVFLVTKVYTVSGVSMTFFLFIWPFILLIFVLFLLINLIHIVISGSCIQTRQQYLCKQFERLLDQLNRKRPTVRRVEQVWPQYLALNRSALSINLQLQAFNTFYTNYLTVVFLQYTIVLVMLSYIFFFISSEQFIIVLMKSAITVAIFEMIVLLFGLIQFCARVVKKNGQIGKLNRAFAVHCLRGQRRYRLRVGVLLKMETLQWSRLLHFYAFKLFGHSRITSKTFYAMAINISCFFLYVTKRM